MEHNSALPGICGDHGGLAVQLVDQDLETDRGLAWLGLVSASQDNQQKMDSAITMTAQRGLHGDLGAPAAPAVALDQGRGGELVGRVQGGVFLANQRKVDSAREGLAQIGVNGDPGVLAQ